MNAYEVLYIILPELGDEATEAVIEKYSGIISANGGEVEKTDKRGRTPLAYPIDYKTEGYYVLVDFRSPPDFPRELERNFKNDENILRYMVTKRIEK